MERKTFATNIVKRRGNHVCLYTGVDSTGHPAWYYLLLDFKNKILFSKTHSQAIDLKNFGTILYSGYGTQPPQTITKRMTDEYGFVPQSA